MATTAQNNLVQNVGFEMKVPFKVKTDGTADINQGDQVYLDTSAHTVKSVGSDGNAATFVGVAADTSFRNLYGTKQYPDSGTIQVYIAGIFYFGQTSGDTYHDGDSVYVGADAQTITNTAGGNTNIIGYIKIRPGLSSVAYAAGTTIDVLIVPKQRSI